MRMREIERGRRKRPTVELDDNTTSTRVTRREKALADVRYDMQRSYAIDRDGRTEWPLDMPRKFRRNAERELMRRRLS